SGPQPPFRWTSRARSYRPPCHGTRVPKRQGDPMNRQRRIAIVVSAGLLALAAAACSDSSSTSTSTTGHHNPIVNAPEGTVPGLDPAGGTVPVNAPLIAP